MSLATFQDQPFRAHHTVAFASVSTPVLGDLTQSERWEYDRLPGDNEARRLDWFAGRCAGKRAVAARCGIPVERLQLVSRARAGPRCMVLDGARWNHLPVSLSIAHCDGVAIAAAAEGSTRVGVDIERVGEIAPEHLRYFLAPRERCADASLA